jgi:hypothetical protein
MRATGWDIGEEVLTGQGVAWVEMENLATHLGWRLGLIGCDSSEVGIALKKWREDN